MNRTLSSLLALAVTCSISFPMAGKEPARPAKPATPAAPATAPTLFNPALAEKLGADERGMRMFVLCILKTGPKDAEVTGDARKEIFNGHFANIQRLADERKLSVAGPFGKNDKEWRGLYIFNVATIEEAEKLVKLDPAVAAGVFVADLTPWYGSAAMLVVNDTHKRIVKPGK
jgi:uncharacterized protein